MTLARHGGLLAREATYRDIANVAIRLGEADRREAEAATGLPGHRACMASALASDWVVAVVRESSDLAIAVFGVCPAWLPGHGIPWLLAAPELEEVHSRTFLRYCRRFLSRMLADYSVLANWVDARNTAAMRWLRWLGFTLQPAAPFGPLGLPFHPFNLRRPHVYGC